MEEHLRRKRGMSGLDLDEIIELLTELNVWSVSLRILLALIFGGCIGLERGYHGRAAGLRTHILVCVGAAMTSLTGIFGTTLLGGGDAFRISAQVISGIGFLGVGMILVRNRTIVTGLTTAAGMWATATIGIAVGYGFYLGAVIATVICSVAVTLLGHIEEKGKTISNIYLEISDISRTGEIVRNLRTLFDSSVSIDIISPKSNTKEHLGILILIKEFTISEDTLAKIEKVDGVEFLVENCNA